MPSDYSYPQSSMASNASGIFSFSQTEPSADLLTGSSLGIHEGPQNFQDFPDNGSCHSEDAEEYLFTSGQTTPKGSRTDHPQTTEAMWTMARTASLASTVAQAMSRASSSRSSASSMSQSSHLSGLDSTGNPSAFRNGSQPAGSMAGMDSCLLLDSDSSTVPHIYWSDYSLDMNINARGNGVFPLPEADPLHVVPAYMHLGTEAGLPDNSSPSSWDCFSSSISRTSSPATIDDTWLSAPLSPHSSPDIKCQSPSAERKLPMIPENPNGQGVAKLEDSISLSQTFVPRRQSSDGESARDHALYKNATPRADGLFHCPWEGQPTCNHKPKKLKCNYDKFADSHLKLYCCKAETCEGARFSSLLASSATNARLMVCMAMATSLTFACTRAVSVPFWAMDFPDSGTSGPHEARSQRSPKRWWHPAIRVRRTVYQGPQTEDGCARAADGRGPQGDGEVGASG